MSGMAAALAAPHMGAMLPRAIPLGVQALVLREALVRDFAGTLRVLRAIGYGAIELASFRGFLGHPRGDFSPLEKWDPRVIGRMIRAAGLVCQSCHFLPHEFEEPVIAETIGWARAIGIKRMVFTGYPLAARASRAELEAYFTVLARVSSRVHALGMMFAVHSDAAMWQPLGEGLIADLLVANGAADRCAIQLDFGSVVQAGVAGDAILRRYPGRIASIHLRDAIRPADVDAYLPALPLGRGGVDWRAVLSAARETGVREMYVEMQLRPLVGVLDAEKESYDYLHAIGARFE